MTTNDTPAIFREEWLACLCAHYLYTLRAGDQKNAEGLLGVLLEAGMAGSDIDMLALSAGFAPPSQKVAIEVYPPVAEEADQSSPTLPAVEREAVAVETQSQSVPLAPPETEAFMSPTESAETEPSEVPAVSPLLVTEPAFPLDLFSLPPVSDTAPAESLSSPLSLPAVEPDPPADPTMLPLPLNDSADIPEDSLSNPVKRVRTKSKPKPKLPPQRPLF